MTRMRGTQTLIHLAPKRRATHSVFARLRDERWQLHILCIEPLIHRLQRVR